jgi:Mg-chelatase subunit ChlD
MEVQHMTTESNGPHTNVLGQPELSSFTHVDFRIHVERLARSSQRNQAPPAISLVLDRSGSMHGQKIATAACRLGHQ